VHPEFAAGQRAAQVSLQLQALHRAQAALIVVGLGSQWLWIDRFLVVSTTAKVGLFP
jgi:hypothetical protein